MAETEKQDPLTDDGQSSGQGYESELKTTKGLRGLQVSVTDINMERQDSPEAFTVKNPEDMNGEAPIRRRGRPKSLGKHKLNSNGKDSEENLASPRKRGRPKGSSNKQKSDTSNDDKADGNTPKRGRPKKGKRGGPNKMVQGQDQTADGSAHPKKRLGRPKGSPNKPVVAIRLESTSGRPVRPRVAPDKLNVSLPRRYPGKRGRPKKISRGRPRVKPLSQDEEPYQPRVWKALGRPRKYPKGDQPEGASSPETPRRSRGRPRKSDSKKGAHLKKINSEGTPNKPKAGKEQDGAPKKRGRPKSLVKNQAIVDNSSEKTCPNSGDGKKRNREAATFKPNEDNSVPVE